MTKTQLVQKRYTEKLKKVKKEIGLNIKKHKEHNKKAKKLTKTMKSSSTNYKNQKHNKNTREKAK